MENKVPARLMKYQKKWQRLEEQNKNNPKNKMERVYLD